MAHLYIETSATLEVAVLVKVKYNIMNWLGKWMMGDKK